MTLTEENIHRILIIALLLLLVLVLYSTFADEERIALIIFSIILGIIAF